MSNVKFLTGELVRVNQELPYGDGTVVLHEGAIGDVVVADTGDDSCHVHIDGNIFNLKYDWLETVDEYNQRSWAKQIASLASDFKPGRVPNNQTKYDFRPAWIMIHGLGSVGSRVYKLVYDSWVKCGMPAVDYFINHVCPNPADISKASSADKTTQTVDKPTEEVKYFCESCLKTFHMNIHSDSMRKRTGCTFCPKCIQEGNKMAKEVGSAAQSEKANSDRAKDDISIYSISPTEHALLVEAVDQLRSTYQVWLTAKHATPIERELSSLKIGILDRVRSKLV
jgi:hypothetical protein